MTTSERSSNAGRPKSDDRFAATVRRKAARRKGREEARSSWSWFGLFGMVGWSVAAPVFVLTLLGVWIDRRWPSRVSWTLTLLFGGFAAGCLVAWYWVRRESEDQ